MNGNVVLFSRNFFRRETTTRGVKVAGIIAPILTVMNHYDEIINLRFTPVFFFKSVLTFFVPYFVSAYSSAKAYSDPKSLNNSLPRN
jgi:hypothetical protein